MMTSIFGIQIKIKVFYKVILSFWLCVTGHAQSAQNKFAYLFNVFRKAWGLIFLPADKHKSFLEVDSITLSVRSKVSPK